MSTAGETTAPWEGLGGPVAVDRVDFGNIDPALDACCRREMEGNQRKSAIQRTLERHDVVAARERMRRNMVVTSGTHAACRCCPYGSGGDYPALAELRTQRRLEQASLEEKQQKDDQEENVEDNGVDNLSPAAPKEEDRSNDDSDDDEFDYLLDEDLPGTTALEQDRRAELELAMVAAELAQHHGFGVCRPVPPQVVWKTVGLTSSHDDVPPPAAILLLYDPDSAASTSLDLYLEEQVAPKARGTLFVRSPGRLVDLEQVPLPRHVRPSEDLPLLVAVREGAVVAVSGPKLQGLVEGSEVEPNAVDAWLDRAGVLIAQPPALDAIPCRLRPEQEALLDSMRAAKDEAEEYYDCGVPNCCKTFAHQHVGVETTQQEGRVLSEAEILGKSE